MTNRKWIDHHRSLRMFGAMAGLSFALGACTNMTGEVATASIPDDYRQRHPIAIREADRSIVIFVGSARGGLSASQRADVVSLGRTWVREGTGAIVADVPVDAPNARAVAATLQAVRTVLEESGVPARGITLHKYRADDLETGNIKLSYPRMAAVAGPCGQWPEDLGPSILNDRYTENKPYYNFGCATQRNLAAMIDNPSDLEHPRPETPAYTARRTAGFDKYRRGEPTATSYPDAEKAKLSDTGK